MTLPLARTIVRRRRVPLALACAAHLACATPLQAQTTGPIILSPSAVLATDLNPGGTLLIGDLPSFPVTLQWRVPASRSSRELRPVRASSFQVCFYEQGATHDCRARSGTVAVLDVAGTALVTRPVTPSSWWDRYFRRRPPDLTYEYVATLPQSALDKALDWVVIACGGDVRPSCSQSSARSLAFTARDIAIRRIDSHKDTLLGVSAYIEVRNDGRTRGEPFSVVTRAWEVLPNAAGTYVLTDLNDPDVLPTDTVITLRGETYSVASYRQDGRPTGDILGFHRAVFASATWRRDEAEVPQGLPAGQPLRAGTCPTENDPCPTTAMSVLNCNGDVLCWLAPRRTQRPTAFVMHAVVNPGNDYDFDQPDNQDFRRRIILN